jgi:flagellar hook-length control protein FliK
VEVPASTAAKAAVVEGVQASVTAAPPPVAPEVASVESLPAAGTPRQLGSRIAETVHAAVMRGDNEVRLVLNPPELGRLDIRIVDARDGLLVAMEATTNEARELISRALVSLQAALEARELRVDRLTVEHSQQSQDEPGWQGQRGEDGRPRGRGAESSGNGFDAPEGEARDASVIGEPQRRASAPRGGPRGGALDLVA